jgi:hypothetical protein
LQKEKGKFYGNALFCMLLNGHPSILPFQIPYWLFVFLLVGVWGWEEKVYLWSVIESNLGQPNIVLYSYNSCKLKQVLALLHLRSWIQFLNIVYVICQQPMPYPLYAIINMAWHGNPLYGCIFHVCNGTKPCILSTLKFPHPSQ